VRPVGLCQRKIPMTPSGIKPATFQLVEQCLNQLCHHIPQFIYWVTKKISSKFTKQWTWEWENMLNNKSPLYVRFTVPLYHVKSLGFNYQVQMFRTLETVLHKFTKLLFNNMYAHQSINCMVVKHAAECCARDLFWYTAVQYLLVALWCQVWKSLHKSPCAPQCESHQFIIPLPEQILNSSDTAIPNHAKF
jgi:hypothetical protein